MHSSALVQTTLQKTPERDPATLTCSVFGVRVDIRLHDTSLVDTISERLPPGWGQRSSDRVDRTYEFLNSAPGWSRHRDGVGGVPCWYLLADRSLVCHTDDTAALSDRFQADLELFLAVRARTHVLVHAAVVGWRGRAIIIPGRNVSGNAALAEALIGLGAEHYSDRYAVIDPRGLVSSSPWPPTIREGVTSRRGYTADEVRAATGRPPIPIGTIVVSEYQSGTVRPSRHLSRGEAVLALLSNAPAARSQPGFLLKTLSVAVRGAIVLSSPRDDVRALAERLLVDRGESSEA